MNGVQKFTLTYVTMTQYPNYSGTVSNYKEIGVVHFTLKLIKQSKLFWEHLRL